MCWLPAFTISNSDMFIKWQKCLHLSHWLQNSISSLFWHYYYYFFNYYFFLPSVDLIIVMLGWGDRQRSQNLTVIHTWLIYGEPHWMPHSLAVVLTLILIAVLSGICLVHQQALARPQISVVFAHFFWGNHAYLGSHLSVVVFGSWPWYVRNHWWW